MFSGKMDTGLLPWMATILLVVGVYFDLRQKKYPNRIFVISASIALISVVVIEGLGGLHSAFLGFLLGALALLPLVLAKAVGAGDLKLLAATGLLIGPQAVVMTAVWGLIWATVLGVVRIVSAGEGRAFYSNLVSIVLLRQREGLKLHSIPLTVGLLLGWLSHWLVFRGTPI